METKRGFFFFLCRKGRTLQKSTPVDLKDRKKLTMGCPAPVNKYIPADKAQGVGWKTVKTQNTRTCDVRYVSVKDRKATPMDSQ